MFLILTALTIKSASGNIPKEGKSYYYYFKKELYFFSGAYLVRKDQPPAVRH